MCDSNSTPFSPSFNGSIRVQVSPETLTCHPGIMLLRERDATRDITPAVDTKPTD